jgi:hypothetical protein
LRAQRGVADIVGTAFGRDDAGGRVRAAMLPRCSGFASHQHRDVGTIARTASITESVRAARADRTSSKITADDSEGMTNMPSPTKPAMATAAASHAIQIMLMPP